MVPQKMKEAFKNEVKSEAGTKPAKTDIGGMIIDKIITDARVRWALVALVVVACIALGIRIYSTLKGPEGTAVNQAVLTVATENAKITPFEQHLKITGTIWARDHLTVGAEIGGLKVDAIKVDEGDFVTKGQLLVSLNSSLLEAQLDREQARLSRARANLDKTIQPNRPMDIARLEFAVQHADAIISQEEANIKRAKANLVNAQQNTVRYKQLRSEGAVSQEDLDNKTTTENTFAADLSNAEEKLRAAKFSKQQAQESLKLAKEGGSSEDVSMAKADLAEGRATVDHIRAQIAQTFIRAPEDGWIVKRHVHLGDISSVSEPLFEMVKNNHLEVRAEMPENDLPLLKPGQEVEFATLSRPDLKFKGIVREVSPMVDRDTRLALARIDIPFDHNVRKPGMFVNGIVDLGEIPSLTVPSKAVLDRDGRKIVFVFKDGKVFSRIVKTGETFENHTQILSGLKKGEAVVVTGAGFLKDGDIVRLGEEGNIQDSDSTMSADQGAKSTEK